MPKASLEKYRSMRDFSKTPEPPPGDADAAERNLRFVVQQHAARNMHWDFRLEVDGVLKSWPLPKGPSLDPKVKRQGIMTEDHPYEYRTFEGVIPKGEYGGGQVIVWDEGIYTPDEDGVTSWDDKEEGSRRMNEGIERGKLSFTLQGRKLKGSFALVKTNYGPKTWLMLKHKDEHATEADILEHDRSVRSGLTIQDLKEGKMPNAAALSLEAQAGARLASFPEPSKLKPMLATLVDKAFDSPTWLWEPKLDGVRTLAFINKGKVDLRSRRGMDTTKTYANVAALLARQPAETMVLDGEVCALDDAGVPRFELLQSRINLQRGGDIARIEAERPAVFFAFDLLYLDGYDLMRVPLKQRRMLLEAKLIVDGAVRLGTSIEESGVALEEAAKAMGFEGVVGKRADSRYEPGARSKSWIKVKNVTAQEFVVGGYTQGEGARGKTFGALSIGYYEGEALKYASNVGSGFNDGQLDSIYKRLKDLETDKSPFENVAMVEGKPKWVRPEIVVQAKFAEWTRDGRLRAPVFLGLRSDIDPRQVVREREAKAASVAEVDEVPSETAAHNDDVALVLQQLENPKANFNVDVAGQDVKLTNLDKEFWPAHDDIPAMTKRDLIKFYVNVAPWLLPHLKDRPLTLTRYPNGIKGSLFYQKHYEQPIPAFVDTTMIWSGHNEQDGEYIMCNNLPTLVWLAQIADIELHAWMSRLDAEPDAHGRSLFAAGSEETIDASVLNYPDYVVFDLDPYIYAGHEKGKEEPEYNKRGWTTTVEIALSLKDMLDGLKLSSFVKTSGKTGIHVYVPVLRHYDYDEIRAMTAALGRALLAKHPTDLTMEWDTSKRKGKVFFDHNQNTRGKTLAAQYSLRPTAWAGVSTPLQWSELAKIDPVQFNMRTVVKRLQERGDPWADILSRKNDLRPLLSP